MMGKFGSSTPHIPVRHLVQLVPATKVEKVGQQSSRGRDHSSELGDAHEVSQWCGCGRVVQS